jgi:uncharacterized protein YndB with AHSA1/START domain
LQDEEKFYYCSPWNYDQYQKMSKKQLYTLEYPVRCSPTILYEFLSTSSGLQEWFADKVDDSNGMFTFSWNGSEEHAEVLESEEEKYIRFHWTHAPKEEYFEFRIEKSEVSNQTILVIKDFADKKEIKDQSMLWDHQVKDLFHRLGN